MGLAQARPNYCWKCENCREVHQEYTTVYHWYTACYTHTHTHTLAISCLDGQKKVQKSDHANFLPHLDIVNVPVDCRFTPDWTLLSFLCVPPQGHGSRDQTLGASWSVVFFLNGHYITVSHTSSHASHMQWHFQTRNSWRQLRLDGACRAECQQLHCSFTACAVLWKCILGVHRVCVPWNPSLGVSSVHQLSISWLHRLFCT